MKQELIQMYFMFKPLIIGLVFVIWAWIIIKLVHRL